MEKVKNEEFMQAHKFSCNHKPELEKDRVCGCFYCLNIFSPDMIQEWIIEDNDADRRGTAIERPIWCNVDLYFDRFLATKMTREDWYALNQKACLGLKRSEQEFFSK